MAKIGRNDLCPCGSGKKYKRCCLATDEQAERAAFAAEAAVAPVHNHSGFCDDCCAELTAASNAVVDLIDAGKLDEAEHAAHDLLERFPDAHDGYDRLGMTCEARGDTRQAADYYRKVIAFARERPDFYDRAFEDDYQILIDRLERQQTAG